MQRIIFKSLFILSLFSTISTLGQSYFNVIVGTHNVPITQVNVFHGDSLVEQTSGVFTETNVTTEVRMDSVLIDDNGIKTLSFVNLNGAILRNNNFGDSASGVGVHSRGVDTTTSNIVDFEMALNSVISSRDLLAYLYYDGASGLPSGDDFDVLWGKGLTNEDYLLVSERDGNTFFTVSPLDSTGNPITEARKLRFGYTTADSASVDGNNKYDWNTGYGSANRNSGQPQYLIAVDVELFNTSKTIFGIRIDNLGDADVKFFGASANTFDDNPSNPLVPGILGNVFNDTDGLTDGTVDGTGIATLELDTGELYANLVQGGVVLETVPVSSDGSYQFIKIDAGSYTVVIDTSSSGSTVSRLPANWKSTGENDGAGAGSDGDVNGISSTIVVTDSLETQINFGVQEIPFITVGDFVWNDANGNGIQDPGEAPMGGVEVLLYDASGNPATKVVRYDSTSTTCLSENVATDMSGNSASDNDGSINFSGNWTFASTGNGSNLSHNDEIVNNEISVSGIDGEVARLISPTLASIDTVIVSFSLKQVGFDATDNGIAEYYNGSSWVNLGTYTPTELPVSGTYYDFTYVGNSSSLPGLLNIEGIRFIEGAWSSSSEGFYIDDIDITFKSTCTYTVDTLTEQIKDTTDANGNYSFSTAEHGIVASTDYEIRIPLSQDSLSGFDLTGTGAGTSATDNNGTSGGGGTYATSGLFTTPSDIDGTDLDIDFGFVGYSIGNSIWWDNDDDGIKDAGEIGIEGVTVILLDDEGNTIATTTTDSSGNYIFNGLPEGDYQVAVTSPLNSGVLDGATVSSTTNTTADTDSNNDGSSTDPVGATNTPTFTSISNTITLGSSAEPTNEDDEDPGTFQPDNKSNLTIDFGFEPPTTALGNSVFWDKNNDGDFDSGNDEALEGVKVYLYKDTNGDGTPNEIIDSTTTDVNGNYSFEDIGAGSFRLVLAPENFTASGVLSTGSATTNGNSGDGSTDDNSEGSQSGIIVLAPNSQPTSDAGDGSGSYDDDDANFTFDFGIYGNAGGPVPVEFTYFEAKKLGERDALLQWETASELNNEKFEVFKSVDQGETFNLIGEVQGSGTTNEVIRYSYVDVETAGSQEACYRLKQVDYDGVFEWTEMECLNWVRMGEVSVYPNPARDVLNVKVQDSRVQLHVELLDATGKILLYEEGKEEISINTSNLGNGLYVVKIYSGESVQTQRIVIVH